MNRYNDAINICLTTIGESPIPANTSIQPYCSISGVVTEGVCSITTHTTETACTGASPAGTWTKFDNSIACTGATPTAGVWEEGHYEGLLADTIIDESLIEILSQGYHFNTDEDWDLVPDAAGYIAIPAGALSVDASQTNENYIVKSGKLYDKENATYIFTETVQADITWEIAFDDLHSIAQLLVVAKAKMKLYIRVVGVDNAYQVLAQEVVDATTTVRGEDIWSGDYSIFDETSTTRAMSRGQNPTAI